MNRRISGSMVSATSGAPVQLRSGRGPRIIVATHSNRCEVCAAYIRQLGAARDAIAEWGGRLTVVTSGTETAYADAAAESGAELLLTPDVRAALGEEPPALVVVDEWGEVYFSVHADDGHDLPDPADVIEWIRFIAIQCPECEGPEGEWRTL